MNDQPHQPDHSAVPPLPRSQQQPPPFPQHAQANPYATYGGQYAPANPYQSYGQHYAVAPGQSGMGIASLVLSVLAGFGLILLILVAGAIEASTPGGMAEDSPAAIIIGLLLLLDMLLLLVSLGLGVASLFHANRKKLTGILGIIFSVLSFALMALVMIVGAFME